MRSSASVAYAKQTIAMVPKKPDVKQEVLGAVKVVIVQLSGLCRPSFTCQKLQTRAFDHSDLFLDRLQATVGKDVRRGSVAVLIIYTSKSKQSIAAQSMGSLSLIKTFIVWISIPDSVRSFPFSCPSLIRRSACPDTGSFALMDPRSLRRVFRKQYL